jgi:RNA polymerase sigma-70 factor (ECF subfamily)
LEAVCRAYWYPLYAYARRSGWSVHDAQDVTQEFFRHLLTKRWLDSADRNRGRLRSFLVTALRNFMAKEWRKASAQRRGGEAKHIAIDTALAEGRLSSESTVGSSAELVYDRQWALTLIELTMDRLRGEFLAVEKGEGFEVLKECLVAARGEINYGEVARRLGGTEGAARVAVHRLRKRFREIYREEVWQTLAEGEALDAEVQHLARALASV